MIRALHLVVFLLLPLLSFTQVPTFTGDLLPNVQSDILNEQFLRYRTVEIDALALERYLKTGTVTGHPLRLVIGNDIDWQIELMPDDIRSADYTATALHARGEETIPKQANITYSGNVVLPEFGYVRLAIDEYFIYGRFKIGEEIKTGILNH